MVCTIAVAAAGCYSTAYTPQSPGRVSIIMVNNKLAFARDGRTYEHGALGGGLELAVAGVPAAERAAHRYVSKRTSGLVMAIGGLLCSMGAVGFAVDDAVDDSQDPETELYITLGCLAVSYIGIFQIAGAEPYKYDAINIFNDKAPTSKSTWE